jgi:DNA gyrase subunit A
MSNIEKREITEELTKSYIDYAMSVIVSRALPDVRDGLKPVQRRVLWSMWENGVIAPAKHRKSSKVVGDVMGNYHPHGDSSIYDTLVRMAQDFSLRYPLIDGQGNFGSVDGDGAAAMRYTEARMAKVAAELVLDIEKDTVDWLPNYDGTKNEPRVLPAKLPNLLLNGSSGIAVGMATSIPPHNLREICDAVLHLIENPDASVKDLLKFVTGPDFPTGGIVFDGGIIDTAYQTGRGSVAMRAKTEIVEQRKAGAFDIIITEIPYQVNKSELIKKIAELVSEKRVEGIKNLRDESDRDGMRIVVELKNDAAPQKVLNQLFMHTDLQKNFPYNMIALSGGLQPQLMSLKDILSEYVAYRRQVVRRRTQFELQKAKDRAHILDGLMIALLHIDEIIAIIRKSKDKDDARANLIKKFKLSEAQANAILEIRLQSLASMERLRVETELKEKTALIKELEAILKSEARILNLIKIEVGDLREKYGDDRRTAVVKSGLSEFKDEDLIPDEEVMITFSAGGYIKRLDPDSFRSQKRGGKGLIGSDVAEEDFLTQFFPADTHDNLLFFTDRGRAFQTKVYEIPAASRTAKGKAVHNFLEMPAEEKVRAIVNYGKDEPASFLVLATKDGVIKRTKLEDFAHIRRTGIIAITLNQGDALVGAQLTTGKDQILLTTARGQSIRFKEDDVRAMGRSAAGVRAVKLKGNDLVSGFDVVRAGDKDSRVLVVMANGYAKQTPVKEYRLQTRGGSGIKTANITPKTGEIVSSFILTEQTEIFALSAKGQVIRTSLDSVRSTGRAAQGVRLMDIASGDRIAAAAVI